MENFVIELFVRGAVLCLLTAISLRMLHRAPAAYRHLMCVLALCGLLILPLAPRLLPPLLLLAAQSASPLKDATVPTAQTSRLAVNSSEPEIAPAPRLPQKPGVRRSQNPLIPKDSAPPIREVSSTRSVSHQERFAIVTVLLLALWGLVTSTLLVRLIVALVRLGRMEAESRQAVVGDVPVRISEHVNTPLTWGIRRNIILLPAALLSGDPAACGSALRHEQAHIARRDWIWNLLAEVVCALSWFQPGAWWLRRRMRLESERACDDLVLLSGIAGPDYAAHLLAILQSAGTREVAPAMAQSGGLEERMTHILDTTKSRRARRSGSALVVQFGLVLLCLAALRVAARPTEAKPRTGRDAAAWNSRRLDMAEQPSDSIVPAPDSGRSPAANLPDPGQPAMSVNRIVPAAQRSGPMAVALPGTAPLRRNGAAAPPLPGPAVPLDRVVWGKAVDGLEPGFLLNSPSPPNERVPFNSYAAYQVLVRNTTDQERVFIVQCQNHDEMELPYLIPGDDIVEALDSRETPAKYRAKGSSSVLDGLFPAYVVRLAPGESVVVPEELGLYVGNAAKQVHPIIEEIKAGMNWIVQPITIHSVTPADVKEAEAGNSKINLSIASREGRAGLRPALRVPARAGGKRLYAKIQLEVGTLDAEAARNAGNAVWGKADKGLQCGIRLLKPRRAYQIGDTLEAELLWRNTSSARIHSPLPRKLDLYPTIQDAKGHELLIDFGARFELYPISHTFEPGEIRSLGVTAITLVAEGAPSPKSNAEPGQITLVPGVYKLSGFGGVSAQGGGNPRSGEIEFRVGDRTEPSKEEGIAWGEKAGGFQLGARIAQQSPVFKVGDTIKFQTFARNLSGKVVALSVGNYWKVNYKIQVQTADGKPIYMERDGRNKADVVAGYLQESFGKDTTQEISEALLKVAPQPQKGDSIHYDEDEWVEAVSLKPGRYRVRIVSWALFGPGKADPKTAWIPIEVSNK